jgi:hypothetical protein
MNCEDSYILISFTFLLNTFSLGRHFLLLPWAPTNSIFELPFPYSVWYVHSLIYWGKKEVKLRTKNIGILINLQSDIWLMTELNDGYHCCAMNTSHVISIWNLEVEFLRSASAKKVGIIMSKYRECIRISFVFTSYYPLENNKLHTPLGLHYTMHVSLIYWFG